YPSPSLARVAAIRREKLDSLLALPHRHERLPNDDRTTADAGDADRLRRGERPTRPSRTTARRAGLARALPRPGTRSRGCVHLPPDPLRAAGGHRTGLHRRPPAPAPPPAARPPAPR